jgi:hypothetical protein
MLLALVTIALAQEPADPADATAAPVTATADATITLKRPRFADPAPPEGRKVGVGLGYVLGAGAWGPSVGDPFWVPGLFTLTFRGPRHTWVPSLAGEIGTSSTSDLGGWDTNVDALVWQRASAGVSWFPSVVDPQAVSIRPTLCAGGSLESAVDRDDTGTWVITAGAYVCTGMTAQRWIGSRFSTELMLTGLSIHLDQALAHDSVSVEQATVFSIGYLPSATLTATMYFDRARNPE